MHHAFVSCREGPLFPEATRSTLAWDTHPTAISVSCSMIFSSRSGVSRRRCQRRTGNAYAADVVLVLAALAGMTTAAAPSLRTAAHPLRRERFRRLIRHQRSVARFEPASSAGSLACRAACSIAFPKARERIVYEPARAVVGRPPRAVGSATSTEHPG